MRGSTPSRSTSGTTIRQLFSEPADQQRDDEFGGSLPNRAKVARSVVEAVRRAVDDAGAGKIAVTAKLNMADGVTAGSPSRSRCRRRNGSQDDGGLDAIELTAGSSLVNPMYMFRGGAPGKDVPALRQVVREYPYYDAYLLDDARLFRAELTMPLILLGGITNRETMDLAMAEGFEFVAMGRALLAEPDLFNRIKADGDAHTVTSVCTHTNDCMVTIYSHTHCVLTGSPGGASRRGRRWFGHRPRLDVGHHRLLANHAGALGDHQFLRREGVGEAGVQHDELPVGHGSCRDVEHGRPSAAGRDTRSARARRRRSPPATVACGRWRRRTSAFRTAPPC